jgi:cell division protein FtsB
MDHYIPLLGIVLQTVIFLLGGYAMLLRTNATTEALKDEIKGMNEELKQLKDVVVTQAVQTNRLDNLSAQVTTIQRNVEDLRRGNGFVRGRQGVDGEYP